jgi:hypothetical protein
MIPPETGLSYLSNRREADKMLLFLVNGLHGILGQRI